MGTHKTHDGDDPATAVRSGTLTNHPRERAAVATGAHVDGPTSGLCTNKKTSTTLPILSRDRRGARPRSPDTDREPTRHQPRRSAPRDRVRPSPYHSDSAACDWKRSASTEHDHRLVTTRNNLEAEPPIKTHRWIANIGTEAHPRDNLDQPAAERSADTSTAPLSLHGDGELLRVVVDVAVPTIFILKEPRPGGADSVALGFGDEAHVAGSAPESSCVMRDRRRIENGARKWFLTGRDE